MASSWALWLCMSMLWGYTDPVSIKPPHIGGIRSWPGAPHPGFPAIRRHMPLPLLVRRALLTVPLAVYKSVVGTADVGPNVLST